ncbi:MAG: hypothetical protein B7Z69_08630 [Actinobacteria bacterium 21-73-9]|nr:MAG: hypothetical protein B7Z69_08630 [Actinobacteria bacterium 21-73-9]
MLGADRGVTRGEAEQRADGVLGLRGDLHGSILPHRGRASPLTWTRAQPGESPPLPVRGTARGPHRLRAGRRGGRRRRRPGVPFVVNDSPELAAEVGADGVHVGQDDVSVARCRALLGEAAIVGLSTHAEAELESALATSASYLSAGPIVATPTKAGRPGTGVGYALAAQRRSDRPVFVTGGVGAATVGALVGEGLRHFVVVRALTEAADPGAAARALRRALDDALSAVPVEPAQERRHHPGVGP